MFSSFFILLAFVTSSFSISAIATTIPIPDNDPFYHPGPGFESTSPGTILANRTLPSTIPGASAAQILYRTVYSNGTATATVATIFIPSGSTSTSKLVSYAEPEDAANTTCAPSYLFSTNTTSNSNTLSQAVTLAIGYGWTGKLVSFILPLSTLVQPNFKLLFSRRSRPRGLELGVRCGETAWVCRARWTQGGEDLHAC